MLMMLADFFSYASVTVVAGMYNYALAKPSQVKSSQAHSRIFSSCSPLMVRLFFFCFCCSSSVVLLFVCWFFHSVSLVCYNECYLHIKKDARYLLLAKWSESKSTWYSLYMCRHLDTLAENGIIKTKLNK